MMQYFTNQDSITAKAENRMKIIITREEAVHKGIWEKVMQMFGVDQDDDTYANEQFILTEEQAKQLQLI